MKISTIKRMVQEELAIALNNSNNTVKKEKPLAPVIPWEKVIPGEQNFNDSNASSCCQATVQEPITQPSSIDTGIGHEEQPVGNDMHDKMKKIVAIMKAMKSREPQTLEFEGKNVVLGKAMRGDISEYATYLKDCKSGQVKKVNFGKLKGQ